MMQHASHAGLLRARYAGEQHVTPFELFLDLVFVLAVTQLSRRLLEHLTWGGPLETLLMLLVVWSAWVTTTWVTNSSTRIMRVSDAKCAYCEGRHWARETGDARNLVADRQVSLPDGRYCHARCFRHYVIEVGLAEVFGMTRPRQRQLARARLGLPSAKNSLQFVTVRQVCGRVGAHPPEVSQWNQQALARLERMAKTAEMEASQQARRQEVLSRLSALLVEAGALASELEQEGHRAAA